MLWLTFTLLRTGKFVVGFLTLVEIKSFEVLLTRFGIGSELIGFEKTPPPLLGTQVLTCHLFTVFSEFSEKFDAWLADLVGGDRTENRCVLEQEAD